ncbi:MAG: hypothetical protein OQL19_07570 [Gammaproteobacteria bacterium]|nr:hypothetical protein [Gammaproteobacteria bacterium]
MRVENTADQHIAVNKSRQKPTSGNTDFANKLENQQNFNTHLSQKADTLSSNQASLASKPDLNVIKLGSLTGEKTTVAQLLLANPELKSKTWSIIHNPINRNKAFHQISAGKEIYYNPKTQEINWNEFNSNQSTLLTKTAPANTTPPNTSKIASETEVLNNKQDSQLFNKQKIVLGTIDQNNPTISNLLSQQNDLKAQRWNIIHSDINKNKEFTKIPNNTTIYMDSQTKELSWNAPSTATDAEKTVLARKLDDAVKPYMGTEYKDLDCYTLVVNGLENMGIRYRGKGSLSSQLLQRAQIDGRANNAYFTGEGLTEALGDKIYTKAVSSIDNIDKQSQDIFHEMKELMKKGDILSFSLQTKGHTGVISQNKDEWTYINSGRLDNSIRTNSPKHGVGEETLLNEINNWIKLAQKRNEALQITVGRLDKQKFA